MVIVITYHIYTNNMELPTYIISEDQILHNTILIIPNTNS